MTPEYNRYETPMSPGSHWPDGSPVSNWSRSGGLTAATFVTLLVVPVLYAIFVKDLKLVKWEVK